MARPLRIELAGGLYHVTSRGDRREDIYLTDEDRRAWINIFAAACKRFNWICHAYCLMNNHYHIVVETVDGNLSKGMRHLNGVYTQWFNRHHGRIGHVFQGRYKSILVEKEHYLLELARYVVLNPVRARIVEDVRDWPWSSFPAMIGEATRPTWLARDWLLGRFGQQRDIAIGGYIDFVRAGVGLPSVWEKLKNPIYLGSDQFADGLKNSIAHKARLDEIPRAQRRLLAKSLKEYVSGFADRKEGMAKAYLSGAYTMKGIAQQFGVHYSTVSRAVKAFADS